jgi:hypothetical protein
LDDVRLIVEAWEENEQLRWETLVLCTSALGRCYHFFSEEARKCDMSAFERFGVRSNENEFYGKLKREGR